MSGPIHSSCWQVCEYRGYRVFLRLCEWAATDRVKGLDGQWHNIIPTPYGTTMEFVIARPSDDGVLDQIGVAKSEADAKRKIDELLTAERNQ